MGGRGANEKYYEGITNRRRDLTMIATEVSKAVRWRFIMFVKDLK